MENLDKAILLGILAGTGLFVFFVLRQLAKRWDEMHYADAAPVRTETPSQPANVEPIAKPLPAGPVVTTSPVVVPTPLVSSEPPPKPAALKKRKRTPAGKVLDMLKDKDSLAAAFLLREIFAAPIARR
ncbi:MAG: hypothetical protein HYR84_02670 [Planctomycetes bacterium]|nr:hypothetical protein [Planctomycetota bacterium]